VPDAGRGGETHRALQIWLGKWLGLISLNAALLAISGAAVFFLLQWRAMRLPEGEQRILRNEVLVARSAVKEPTLERELEEETNRRLKAALEKAQAVRAGCQADAPANQGGAQAEVQIVSPGQYRPWEIDLGFAKHFLRGQPLFLRVKFNAAQKSPSGTFTALWQVGVPDTARFWQSEPMSLAPDTFHEFEVPPDLLDDKAC